MDPMWVYILASAATGAVVSSVITLFGQWRERKWKRKELLLDKAAMLAVEHNNKIMRIVEHSDQVATIYDHVHITANYYKLLDHLIDTNELPDEAKPKEAE